jgi:hypothetical protein
MTYGAHFRDVSVSPNGTVSQTTGFDGPIVEVVVTHDTKIYRDVTFQNYSGASGQVQVLAPGGHDVSRLGRPGHGEPFGMRASARRPTRCGRMMDWT